MVLRYSNENYKLEFVITDSGNKTIIPGDCKAKVEEDLFEYLCKIMKFPCYEEAHVAKRNFIEDIDNFLFEKFKYDKKEIRSSISEKNKIGVFLRLLEQHYLNNLEVDDLDESIYVREPNVLTPMKFTPFRAHANVNSKCHGNYSPLIDMAFNPSNILNFDGNSTSITIKSRLKEFVEFPKMTNTTIQATQGSNVKKNHDSFENFSEMYQWLKELTDNVVLVQFGKISVTDKLKEIYQQVNSNEGVNLMYRIQTNLMEKIKLAKLQKGEDESLSKLRADINLKFILSTMEKLLVDESNVNGMRWFDSLLRSESFLYSVIALCTELELFIRDDTSMDFSQIMNVCNIGVLDFWRVIHPFERAVKGISRSLKRHLFELEMNIMLSSVWKTNSPLIDLIKSQANQYAFGPSTSQPQSAKKDNDEIKSENKMEEEIKIEEGAKQPHHNQENNKTSSQHEKSTPVKEKESTHHFTGWNKQFFESLLKNLGVRLYTLCSYLHFKQDLMEFVWESVKFVLCENIDLIINRNVDYVLICSIYAVSKKTSAANDCKSFSQILQEYEKLIFAKRDIHQRNIEFNGGMVNLKEFYNNLYLKQCRQFIIATAPQFCTQNDEEKPNPNSTPIATGQITKQILKKMNLDSPLVSTVPHLKQNAENSGNRRTIQEFSLTHTNNSHAPMTPMTRALYAPESPFERPRKQSLQKLKPMI